MRMSDGGAFCWASFGSKYLSVSILLAAVLSLPLFAQQNPERVTTLASTTRLVVLAIVVTDRSGSPVRDLKPEDFTLLENGIPQRVASFETPADHVENTSELIQPSGANVGCSGVRRSMRTRPLPSSCWTNRTRNSWTWRLRAARSASLYAARDRFWPSRQHCWPLPRMD
jgi:hypothetical protein